MIKAGLLYQVWQADFWVFLPCFWFQWSSGYNIIHKLLSPGLFLAWAFFILQGGLAPPFLSE
jgi:hypothetical protein